MKNKDFKYKTSFSANINKIFNDDFEKYFSEANLDSLKPLMPSDIDLKTNKDLIGIVANSAVAGRVNANGDSITNETAINIAKNFVLKYCNISHKRDTIVGVIVNCGFSKFGSNEILTEEEAAKSKEPFNISLAIVLWKPALNNKFIDLLESSTDPTSDHYQSISLSWELMFDKFDIAVGSKNIKDSKIIAAEDEKKELESLLKANGGSGKTKDGQLVYRVIKGETKDDFLIPAGVGLVSHPAADVSGIEVIEAQKQEEGQSEIAAQTTEIEAVVSQADNENFTKENKSVTISDKEQISKIMKITKLEDITNDSLKTCEASAVIDFINEQVKQENEKYKTEKQAAESAAKSLKDTQDELTNVKSSLSDLQNKIAQKEAEETYNQRMAYFDDTYAISSDERQAIASEIKDLDKDAFEKVKNKYDLFLKEKSKASIKAKEEAEAAKKTKTPEKPEDKKNDKEPDKDGDDKSSKASDETKADVIDEALKNGKDANGQLPNAAESEVSFADKFAEAFKPENCIEIRKK